jgi:BarA-like signal transduction histidine kinase
MGLNMTGEMVCLTLKISSFVLIGVNIAEQQHTNNNTLDKRAKLDYSLC